MPERTYSWTSLDPSRPPMGGLSGLEYFKAMMRGELPAQPVSSTIGWRIVHVEEGLVRMALTPEEHHLHGGGVVHGGILAILMDSAMAAAIITRLEQGQSVTTVQFGMNNIRRIRVGEGEIIAEGRVNHFGRRTATASATIRSADGRLAAEATSTCMML